MPPPCTGRGLNQEVASATNTANGSKVPAAHQHSKQQFQRSAAHAHLRGCQIYLQVSEDRVMLHPTWQEGTEAASEQEAFHVGINI